MTDRADPAVAVPPGEEGSPPVEPAPEPSAATAAPRAERRKVHYRLSRQVRNRPKVLAARRANLVKARAADKADIYRPTERRRAASRANIQKAIAWRRSPQGNAVARANAFRHGLAVKKLTGLLKPLAETPEDFDRHYRLVQQVFQPESDVEQDLVFSLAKASWRRIRILRARARLEVAVWRRRLARKSQAERLSLEEVTRRAEVISRRMARASNVEDESLALATRIDRLLADLIRARHAADGKGIQESETTEEP